MTSAAPVPLDGHRMITRAYNVALVLMGLFSVLASATPFSLAATILKAVVVP